MLGTRFVAPHRLIQFSGSGTLDGNHGALLPIAAGIWYFFFSPSLPTSSSSSSVFGFIRIFFSLKMFQYVFFSSSFLSIWLDVVVLFNVEMYGAVNGDVFLCEKHYESQRWHSTHFHGLWNALLWHRYTAVKMCTIFVLCVRCAGAAIAAAAAAAVKIHKESRKAVIIFMLVCPNNSD